MCLDGSQKKRVEPTPDWVGVGQQPRGGIVPALCDFTKCKYWQVEEAKGGFLSYFVIPVLSFCC